MIGPGDLDAAVEQITETPAILRLGDLEVKRASCRAGQARLLLEDPEGSTLYVVDLQLGAADDHQVIRLLERWAAKRKRHPGRRCVAVLVAEEVAPRYVNVLGLISRTVPLVVMEMQISEDAAATAPRFTPVGLRLR